MSIFYSRVKNYCQAYKVPGMSKVKILGHYPLFKAHWHASYGQGAKQRWAQKIVGLFENYEISHKASGRHGDSFTVHISFSPEDLSSFSEIFWGNEYKFPWPIHNCQSYFDLGANTGMAALYFVSQCPLKKVVLVEANPALLPVVQKNIQIEFVLENLCVSGESGQSIDFYISDEHRHSSQEPSTKSQKISIPTLSLSDLLDKHGLEKLDILKMDIEGAEYELLEKDFKGFQRCKNIVAEVHGEYEQRTQFCESIKKLGFEIHREGKGVFPCENLFARRLDQ